MRNSVAARARSSRRSKLKKLGHVTFLHDDVVMNILSWLPTKDVLRYRRVCKLWNDLTSSNDFINLHFRRHGTPMILMEDNRYHYHGRDRVLLDRCWGPTQSRPKIHKLYGPPDYGNRILSNNGLIVDCVECFLELGFVVYNPIYRDVVKITVHKPRRNEWYYKDTVCGVFFHPTQKEYCILWRKIPIQHPGSRAQYKILNLESDPKWRDVATQNVAILDHVRPVVIDKYIYMMVDPGPKLSDYYDIMEYDITKEIFRVIHSPVHVNGDCGKIVFLDTDGVLSVIGVVSRNEFMEINIWTLNDGGEQLWKSSTYKVSSNYFVRDYGRVPEAIVFRKGELVLNLDGSLYVCNLVSGKVRKFGGYYGGSNFWAHAISVVSLKNWRSHIHMTDDENENSQR